MMGALGVLGILDFNGNSADDYSSAFISCYMLLFAILLFTYELMWWKTINFVNKSLRKNFGFLYGLKGKAFYLIFVAFLTIGLEEFNDLKALRWATGISFLVMGVLHMFVVCARPEILMEYRAPTGGFDTSTNNGANNPV